MAGNDYSSKSTKCEASDPNPQHAMKQQARCHASCVMHRVSDGSDGTGGVPEQSTVCERSRAVDLTEARVAQAIECSNVLFGRQQLSLPPKRSFSGFYRQYNSQIQSRFLIPRSKPLRERENTLRERLQSSPQVPPKRVGDMLGVG